MTWCCLDLNLPDGRGLDLLRELRRGGSAVPVIILTAMDQIASRIDGLNSGADDYLVKPFDLSELSARVAAVARRYGGNPNPLLRLGDLDIDLARRFISVAGRPVDLTAREWAVLERLVRRPNAIIAKSEIEDSLYEFGAEIESNAVEVYVSRLAQEAGAREPSRPCAASATRSARDHAHRFADVPFHHGAADPRPDAGRRRCLWCGAATYSSYISYHELNEAFDHAPA